MIHTISNLIEEFINAEVEILNQQDIKHPPTIGAMYEGLTEEVLNKTVFKELNLSVAKNSFIEGSETEFDILLVEGEGAKIPYTDRYKFKPEQVIIVIQVKKSLYSKDLEEGFLNLQFLADHYDTIKPEQYVGRLLRDSFRGICRKDLDVFKTGKISLQEEYVYQTLKLEALMPPRIILGYNGFKSERNFRIKFFEYLEKNLTTDFSNKIGGFGPHNFPNLVICDKYSMMKMNGMPFIAPLNEEEWWPFYTTSSYNSSYFLMEVIWSRLSYRFEQLPMEIFGEDLTMEPATIYLSARIRNVQEHLGWDYDYYDAKASILKDNTESTDWLPVFIDETQQVIISELCNKGEIDLSLDKEIEEFVTKGGYKTLNEFIDKLKNTGLVYLVDNKLKLLTDQCQCAILSDGRFVAGDNKSGRLSNWIMKDIERKKNASH